MKKVIEKKEPVYTMPSLADCRVLGMIADACGRADYLAAADGEKVLKGKKKKAGKPNEDDIAAFLHPARQGCVWFPVIAWFFPRMACNFGLGFSRFLEVQHRHIVRDLLRPIIVAQSTVNEHLSLTVKDKYEQLWNVEKLKELCDHAGTALIQCYRVYCHTLKLVNVEEGLKQIPKMYKGRNA